MKTRILFIRFIVASIFGVIVSALITLWSNDKNTGLIMGFVTYWFIIIYSEIQDLKMGK